jgi:hypothetical protein
MDFSKHSSANYRVNQAKFEENWERIFRSKELEKFNSVSMIKSPPVSLDGIKLQFKKLGNKVLWKKQKKQI